MLGVGSNTLSTVGVKGSLSTQEICLHQRLNYRMVHRWLPDMVSSNIIINALFTTGSDCEMMLYMQLAGPQYQYVKWSRLKALKTNIKYAKNEFDFFSRFGISGVCLLVCQSGRCYPDQCVK